MVGNFTFSTICMILCSCSVVSYIQGFLHLFGLAYVHLFVVRMHTNSSDDSFQLCVKKCEWKSSLMRKLKSCILKWHLLTLYMLLEITID